MTTNSEWLNPAWLQRALDAMRTMLLHVEPDLRREMIDFLLEVGFWDRSKISTFANAETRWLACLNPGSQSYFKVVELWALMKRFGRHQLFQAMGDDLGYELRLRPTEERRQLLLEQLRTDVQVAAMALVRATDELAKLDPEARPLRMHPSIMEGTAQFSLPAIGRGLGELGF